MEAGTGIGATAATGVSTPIHESDGEARRGSLKQMLLTGAAPDALLWSGAIASSDVPNLRRDWAQRRALAVADVLGLLAGWLTLSIFWAEPDLGPSGAVMLLAPPAWILMNKLLGLYDRDSVVMHRSTLDELPRLLHSIVLGSLIVLFFAPPVFDADFGRLQTAIFALVALVSTFALRGSARTLVRHVFAGERALIIGSGSVAATVARKLSSHPDYGVELVGFVDDESQHDANGSGLPLPHLGVMEEFEEICREHQVERVIVAFTSMPHEALLNIIRASKRARLKVTIVPRLFEVIGHRFETDEIEGMTLLALRGLARGRSSLALKRLMDLGGAGFGLLLLAPLLAVIAIAVKLSSRGPVFYAQRRVGRGSLPFTMYKFRTMVVGADRMKAGLAHLNEKDDGVMFKIADDPRVTRIGRLLRRTSLDELPQLFNVLRGEMSLVGPRPLVPAENVHVIGWHRARLDLTPGLTGPWQVMGRTAIPFQEMVKMDYLYVAEWSLWNDVRLLLRTAPVVLFGRGA